MNKKDENILSKMDSAKKYILRLDEIYGSENSPRFFPGKCDGSILALTTQEIIAGIEMARNFFITDGDKTFDEVSLAYGVHAVSIPRLVVIFVNEDVISNGVKRANDKKTRYIF